MAKPPPLTLNGAAAITGPATITRPALGGIVAAVAAGTRDTSVPVDDLSTHPDNPRTTLGDLDELAASIAVSGIIEPLVVATATAWRAANPDRPAPAGRWVVLAGHRRLAAAHLAGVDRVPIHVRDDLADPQTTTAAMLIENIHRADLPPLDEAAALARLVATGLSQREIARRTGISQPKISKRLALLTLPGAAKHDLAGGHLTVTDALRLLELPAELRESAYRQAKQPGSTLDYVLHIVRQRLDTEAGAAQLATELAARGIRTIDPDVEFGQEAWAHHLWRESDIAAAEAAGVLLAHIVRGRAEYYATTPEPWPWQPAIESGADDVAPGCGSPAAGRAAAAAAVQARHDVIRAALAEPMPLDRQLRILAKLTLIPWRGNEDVALARDLLGQQQPRNGNRRGGDDDLAQLAHGTDAIRAALAVAFARAEQSIPYGTGELDQTAAAYLTLLAEELDYPNDRDE